MISLAIFSSCEDGETPVTITASSSFTEAVSVSIPQTASGVSATYNETVNQNLSEVVSNLNDVTALNIDALSYQYKNVSGNSNAVIESATITINGIIVAAISNVNISQSATAGTVFNITDEGTLNQLENLLLNTSSVEIVFAGTAISDEGPVNFDVEVTIDLTATL